MRDPSDRLNPRRAATIALVLAAHAGLIALLLRPMLLPVPAAPETLTVVNIALPPPPAPEAEKPAEPQPEAKAAPPAPRARPRPVAAPPPPLPTEPVPSPVAPAPADGSETVAGAAAQGPGSGAMGEGIGTGAGQAGSGTGGGGGRVRAKWREGRIDRRDYPPDASRAGVTGSVTAHFDVGADGRVSGCIVVRSSGSPALDRTTCRLIEQRFRYLPARDAAGNPVPDVAGWRQDWWLEPPR